MTRFLTLLLPVCALFAQAPVVGDINYYGLHKISAEKIAGAAKLKSGHPDSAFEGRPGGRDRGNPRAWCWRGWRRSAAMAQRRSLFIGIEEQGAAHPAFHSPPAGDAALPPETVEAYQKFLAAVARAASRGNAAEDLTAGHSLIADADARTFQQQFLSFAGEHLDLLRNVLRTAADAEQRAIAAAVIGYAPRKQDVLNDLQYAVQDPDESVRVNAIRGLKAIGSPGGEAAEPGHPDIAHVVHRDAELGGAQRSHGIRQGAADADRPRQPEYRRSRSANGRCLRWRKWPAGRRCAYALPSYLLLGRVAGIPEEQIQSELGQRGPRNRDRQGARGACEEAVAL